MARELDPFLPAGQGRRALALIALVLVVPACGQDDDEASSPPPAPSTVSSVSRVVDGDTIRLTNGDRVRLVQIDAPELAQRECYAREAKAELERLLLNRARVRLEFDPNLDRVDRHGRQLAYVFRGATNVNLALVGRGAASVSFYRGARGRYADDLVLIEHEAQVAGLGLWSACAPRQRPGSTGQPHG
jgi:micrococcal nuclease